MPTLLFDEARGQRVPLHVWAGDASVEALRQLTGIASRPYVVRHVAAMADAHVAHGVAVGTVFATEHTVVPRALGGDLGCGIAASRLSLGHEALDRRTLERNIEALGRAIPAGDAVHRGAGVSVPEVLREGALSTHALLRTRDALARKHLATLGGGNHFLEIDRDAEGGLWLLVHSGSRGLVPGSMATASYVVEGLGCPLSFDSCSHGAGRVLTRTEARARIRPHALARDMRRIVWPEHLARRLCEEAPAAYREIEEVLRAQRDLVKRRNRLEPIAVLKG